MLIDTHAHLYWDSYKDDLEEVIQRALDTEVSIIINVGVDVEKSKIAVKLESSKVKFYSTIGIHPHEAVKLEGLEGSIRQLEQIYQSNPQKVVAVGECGLDFAFEGLEGIEGLEGEKIKTKQKQLFQVQINLAKKLSLPLIVHSRDDRSKNPQNSQAWDEVLEMVKDHLTILHCYSGLLKTTQKVLKMPNALISFAGNITYPKNEYLKDAVRLIPLDRIILETDCPFLPPQSKRGQRNEPANVVEIAQLIADIKGVSFEKVATQTTANVTQLFAF